MSDLGRLHLYEEVLLLALNDDRGTVHMGAAFDQAAAAAILSELALDGRIGFEGPKGKERTVVRDARPTGVALLDEALAMVAADAKPRRPVHWVGKFAAIRKLKHRAADRLVAEGVLRRDEGRVLLIFPLTRYPEADSRPEREIIHRMKSAILGAKLEISPRTAVLVALAKQGGLLPYVMDKRLLKENTERLDRIVAGELAGQAAGEAIEALQAALMVAVFVPVVAGAAR